jgi:hypothetical protein
MLESIVPRPSFETPAARAPQDEVGVCGECARRCTILGPHLGRRPNLSPHPEERGEAARLEGWPHRYEFMRGQEETGLR